MTMQLNWMSNWRKRITTEGMPKLPFGDDEGALATTIKRSHSIRNMPVRMSIGSILKKHKGDLSEHWLIAVAPLN